MSDVRATGRIDGRRDKAGEIGRRALVIFFTGAVVSRPSVRY